jgi:hypothetical protein
MEKIGDFKELISKEREEMKKHVLLNSEEPPVIPDLIPLAPETDFDGVLVRDLKLRQVPSFLWQHIGTNGWIRYFKKNKARYNLYMNRQPHILSPIRHPRNLYPFLRVFVGFWMIGMVFSFGKQYRKVLKIIF